MSYRKSRRRSIALIVGAACALLVMSAGSASAQTKESVKVKVTNELKSSSNCEITAWGSGVPAGALVSVRTDGPSGSPKDTTANSRGSFRHSWTGWGSNWNYNFTITVYVNGVLFDDAAISNTCTNV